MTTTNEKQAIIIIEILEEGYLITTAEKGARDPETESAAKLFRQVIAKLDPVQVKQIAVEDLSNLSAGITAEINRL